MRSLPVLLVIAIIASACQPSSITISFGLPTPTSTWTPTPMVDAAATAAVQAGATATAQAQVQATTNARATADAQATATAQAAATVTTQAHATATAAAQASATAQANATATARVQATAAAQAAATATTQALVAAINAIADAAPAKPLIVREETIPGVASPYITTYNPALDMLNFVAEVQFFNPADPKIHPWNFGLFSDAEPDPISIVL